MRITDIVVIVIQCIWGICEFVIKKKMTASGKNADQKSYKVLYTITIFSLALGICIGWLLKFNPVKGLYSASMVFPVVGSVIILSGLMIRLCAIATLKRYFTVNVTIQENHKLITSGLYQYIRHPAYAGGILSFIGCGLCYGNPLSFVCISVPYFILILMRIKHEEIVLVNQFGKDYTELQSKTKKLIPYIF
ncbi:MAG: isoprenylcysteine carboxylmethyltransferase family protein [Clostridia bacterium]|nr:isoprenylcysteine carboxylmethyltransferase family protein [Clostridia bacterium]